MTPALCVMKKSVWLVLAKIKETTEVFFGKKFQDVVITVLSLMTSSPFKSYFRATLLSSSIEILLWYRHHFVCLLVSAMLRFFLFKERVKCDGFFGEFIMTPSSSSSSSSSYWMSSTVKDNVKGKSTTAAAPGPLFHGQSKSWGWGWAFASTMRALSKPSSSKVEYKNARKRDITPNKPNLTAIPSLLAMRG